jgi:putative membrane-bound dehydrogenase-like protein
MLDVPARPVTPFEGHLDAVDGRARFLICKIMHSFLHKVSHYRLLLACILMATGCQRAGGPITFQSPVSPVDAVKTFELPPGFKIELVASEPLIADPVAMEIDEHGNLYVVENHGYPLDKSKRSRVKLLSDTDGDGVMDRSTIFADTLMMPTGVLRWKAGILVTDAPDLLYMEDADGDGVADIIKPVLTGFALSNPQHNVNTPILGLDNWIYIAHERAVGSEVYKDEFGDQGSAIYFPDKPAGPRLPQNANGRNVRIRPDSYALEMLASTTQYGHSFDAWGNHFVANNSNHLMHSVIGAEYLKRNPNLLAVSSTNSLPDHGDAAEVFPITKTPDRQLLTDVGVMTSACAITAYAGGAFHEEYNTLTTFVAEPVSNIVHVDRLMDKGSSFVASRVALEKEFLASTDMWCRPVNLYTGPDGALYVVDYYREIIEHPEWLSEDVIGSGRLYNGADMGRIYRISVEGAGPPSWTKGLDLFNAADHELVEKLADDNIWWRRAAQRLLVDRQSAEAIPPLVSMLHNQESAPGRLHALWTLEGMQALKTDHIEEALQDKEAGVRVNAIKLAEHHLQDAPSLVASLLALKDDSDPKVRFQLLCTLGFVNSPQAGEARKDLLFRDVEDQFVQTAALSAPSSQMENLLDSVLVRYEPGSPAYGSLVQRLAAMVSAEAGSPSVGRLLRNSTEIIPEEKITWQVPVLKGLARGFASRKTPISTAEQHLLFDAFFRHPALSVKEASLRVLQSQKLSGGDQIIPALEKARVIAQAASASEKERALAIRFLALRNPVADAAFLKKVLLSPEPLPVQLAAMHTLNSIPDETIIHFSMEHWSELDPAVQDAALNAFMEKETRIEILLRALESGKVDRNRMGWQRSIRLMTQRNIEIRNRARAFFSNDDQTHQRVVEYRAALELKGDVAKGQGVYQRSCAICHRMKGEHGIAFGPDLGTIQTWPAAGILENIIDPNQSISHGFDLWNVILKNGETLQGIITAETPASVTLRNANGFVVTLAREEIESQKALNMSAMPVGLEKDISHQEMADLLAFLKRG